MAASLANSSQTARRVALSDMGPDRAHATACPAGRPRYGTRVTASHRPLLAMGLRLAAVAVLATLTMRSIHCR